MPYNFTQKVSVWGCVIFLFLFVYTPNRAASQTRSFTDTTPTLTLDQCINYALQHQPGINEALINLEITKTTNSINLSGWLPQVNANGSLVHYLQAPTEFEVNPVNPNGPLIKTTSVITNTANPTLAATQTIFNPQLLYAANSAPLYKKEAEQSIDSGKIGIVSSLSKSFYSLIQTLEQIDVLKGDTARDARNVKDTYHQYIGGIVDKTDYEEAVITLNNSKAQLRTQVNDVSPGYAILKQLMGYPPAAQFNVAIDTLLTKQVAFDTTQVLQYEKRIEYQQLQTIKSIQHQTTDYYRLAFLPTVSGFFDYDYQFESNNFSSLFSNGYPNSYLGVSVNIPIFTGLSRLENIHKSKLQEQILSWTDVNLKSSIYVQFSTALANYKSNLYNMRMMSDNKTEANSVYNIVSLQYKQGTVPYLNVIIAESNLISAEIGYINALFQVLSNKIDLEKALGIIPINTSTR